MPISFTLKERPAGVALTAAETGENIDILFRELLGPSAGLRLTDRLDGIHRSWLHHIEGLPSPASIDNLLVVINNDLSGTAYVNELVITADVEPNRAIEAGEQVLVTDIADIRSVDLGVEVPPESGVILILSFGWRRSLFFDFGPLLPHEGPRTYELGAALAQQQLQLLGLVVPEDGANVGSTRLQLMENGLHELQQLLTQQSTNEGDYQALLERHPWILGGTYSTVTRHSKLDDENIPDFTAVRSYDDCHDPIELKHPFLTLFRGDGEFGAEFNNAWNQSERYVDFTDQHRNYLLDQKNLRFENARCLLIMGHKLDDAQRKKIQSKERMSQRITVITYDQLVKIAQHLLNLMKSAGEPMEPGRSTSPD